MTDTKMELADWLDDLCVRFIINLPKEDLSSVARICFQVEEAQWYYEDFIRPLDPTLPSMSLRTFCMRIFQHCPLLSSFSATDHMGAFEEFMLYKTRVPVRGAIMLNEAMDSVLLVKGWKKNANWSFPRGKINKDEDDLDCAIREVYEETGYDIKAAGLVPDNEQVKYIEMEMREQHMRLYVFRSVPMDTHFEPRTRKEISKIQWWKLSDLPAFRKKNKAQNQDVGVQGATNANKFYMVAPFLRPLKTWVVEQKKKDNKRMASGHHLSSSMGIDDVLTEEEPMPLGASCDEGPSSFQYPQADNGASDTMAKTTEALKRLLKIQPATQGIQSQLSSPIEKAKSNSKGSDLLALLRGQSGLEPPKATVLPHTPVELTFDAATIPRTPHHQPPPPRDLSSMPPPPSFPIAPTPASYNGRQSRMHNREPQAAGLSYVQPQTHVQESRGHVQQLRHPQPLPPQIQRTLFNGNLAHSPAVAQLQAQTSAPNGNARGSLAVPHPQFPDVHGPMVSEPKLMPNLKLTEHSLALLNAFKARDKEAGPAAAGPSQDLPLRTYSQDTIKPSNAMAPPLAVPESGRSALSPPSGNNFAAPSMLYARVPPSEAHKSSLLNIFKQPGGIPATTASTSNMNVLAQPAPLPKPASQDIPISHAHPAVLTVNPLNPQLTNLATEPFSSQMSPIPILSRPCTYESAESKYIKAHARAPFSTAGQKPNHQNGTHAHTVREQSTRNVQTAQKAFQPQILKRPQQSPVSQHRNFTVPAQPLQTTSLNNLHTPNTPVSSSLESRRPSHGTEHQQALLALFSKKPATNSSNAPPMTTTQNQQPPADLSRSRIGSLGDTASRRGSQTPLSPADQGFLLDYLAGVAKNHGR